MIQLANYVHFKPGEAGLEEIFAILLYNIKYFALPSSPTSRPEETK
jgi:hypothetical protein